MARRKPGNGQFETRITKPRLGDAARSAGLLLGSHLSIAGGMHNALTEAQRLNFAAVQVFVKNQRQWAAPPVKPESVAEWRAVRETTGLKAVVAHATYLINLAAPDEVIWEKSVAAFGDELARCDAYDISYLVVHPGAACGQPLAQATQRVAAALDRIFAERPKLRAMPLLEMTAGQGSCLGRRFAEQRMVLDATRHAAHVGVCIDTCHVFAAGYDIRTPTGYAEMLREATDTVGLERIKCWHLNDSKGDLGSCIDRHEHIGKGRIGIGGFRNVIRDERFRRIPMILETPKDETGRMDRDNLRRLEKLLSD